MEHESGSQECVRSRGGRPSARPRPFRKRPPTAAPGATPRDDQKRLPGAVATIARQGKLGFLEAFGVQEPAGGARIEIDSIFRIDSMTKPIVSVAMMMLVEEGCLFLADPLAKYVPAFADPKVAIEGDGGVELVPAERPITIQDLLRHTSGLTYEFVGAGAVQVMYAEKGLPSTN
jgi:CubicO group peptidase (beta-lactamase class C family)